MIRLGSFHCFPCSAAGNQERMDTCVSGDAFKTVISTWVFTLISHFLPSSRHWAERQMRRDFFLSFSQQLLKHTCLHQASRISTKTLVFTSGSRLLPRSTQAHRNKQDKAKIRGGPGSQGAFRAVRGKEFTSHYHSS